MKPSAAWLSLWVAASCCTATHAGESERSWDFNLDAPGTYKVQVLHEVSSATPDPYASGILARYSITIGHETQSREIRVVANRPFVALTIDLPAHQKMHVAISGLSSVALENTHVSVYDASKMPSSQSFQPPKRKFAVEALVRKLLSEPPESLDLARVKLTIDRMIDPQIDVDANLQRLDGIVFKVRMLPGFGETGISKLSALKRYLYEPGSWNEFRAFEYDLKDPLGKNIGNKLLPNYLTSRKGNCVTMPMLVTLLGQRLGIDVTLESAPKHILVKWRNDAAAWVNLEATSGANPARDVWIRQQMPMTDEAIRNGVYLRPLTRTESAALIATTLAEYYLAAGKYEEAIVIADVVLEYHPKSAETMVLKGSAFSRLSHREFVSKYPSPAQIPAADRAYFQYLLQNNQLWFARAEALGWRAERAEDEQRYLENVDRARQRPTPND